MSGDRHKRAHYGRGAVGNPAGRFAGRRVVPEPEALAEAQDAPAPDTTLGVDRARHVIAWNRSPDVPFDRSINPYRGCEHGCIYCYARASHSFLDLSPGLDFETRLFRKPDAPEQLARELAAPGYRPAPIALGGNTDCWQPVERRERLTRRILEVLLEFGHPVTAITKSALVERDLDLLGALAEQDLVRVQVTLTTRDGGLHRRLEPRAAGPERRLRLIERLTAAGVPTGVLLAPVIPGLNDAELEALVDAAAAAGARHADYIPLRLPWEVKGLFEDWLQAHYPERAGHVMSLVGQLHGGRPGGGGIGSRMRGVGPFATLLAERFRVAAKRAGVAGDWPALSLERFRLPERSGDQLGLFD